jgi:aminoglycoside phosphotransferase (APT) family kinase protein
MVTESDPEIIEVRSDERFDPAPLEAYLRGRLPETDGPFALAQFGGGHANLTYLVRFGDTEYVLRRPPLGPVAPSAHDMGREHHVLSRLWQAYPLAPRSFLLCTDKSVIGADFHIMERRHGIAIRTTLPAGYDWTPQLNERLGHMILDVLASLHMVDPASVGLGDLGHPEGFIARQLAGWAKRWEAAKDDAAPEGMRGLIGWLEARLPESRAASLLHNDYKLDNMLVGADDPARAVAVLDWDMCTRGDPLSDLGYLLTFWSEAGDDPRWIESAAMPTRAPGFPTRDQLIDRYAVKTGFDCSHADWYHVFGVFKIAVILQQIYIRYLRGQTQDRRFATFGNRVAGLVEKGRALAKL